MWNVLGLIYKAFKTSAVDFMEGKHDFPDSTPQQDGCTDHLVCFFEEMLPCLDNYISYGHQVICSSQEHQAMMYDIIETVGASFFMADYPSASNCAKLSLIAGYEQRSLRRE